jgi:hypothetical protein
MMKINPNHLNFYIFLDKILNLCVTKVVKT